MKELYQDFFDDLFEELLDNNGVLVEAIDIIPHNEVISLQKFFFLENQSQATTNVNGHI